MLFPIKEKMLLIGNTHCRPSENTLRKYEKCVKKVFFIRDIKLDVPYSKYTPPVQ